MNYYICLNFSVLESHNLPKSLLHPAFYNWNENPKKGKRYAKNIIGFIQNVFSPAAKPRFGALPCFEILSFFFDGFVSLGIADDQTESWNFVSVEQFKI